MRHLLNIGVFVSILALTACGPQPPEPAPVPASPPKATNAAGKPETNFTVEAADNMRFSKTLLEVPAGKKITITLVNQGHMPKQQMGHNLIILDQGNDPMAFMAEATFAKDNEYIPEGMESAMIAHTKLLGPGESDTITFTAPTKPGEYVFLCSFPGHYAVGMRGIMRVVTEIP